MMTTERTGCVVTGGGPAGMVLGLLLARAGVEVTVLEKHADFLRDFRGDTVHPSTMRLLDELGLGKQFAALPRSQVTDFTFPLPDGSRVQIADFTKIPGNHRYVAMVPQWDLLNLLAAQAQQEPTFTLRMNTEVTGLLREHGKVTGVTYRTAAGETGELRAELTVAADGRTSVVRQAANLVPHEYPVPIDAWWFRLPRHDGDGVGGLGAQLRAGEAAVLINRGDYYQIAYLIKKGSDAAMRALGVEKFRERVAELAPALADRVDQIKEMDDVKFLDVKLNLLRRWYLPGLLCVGDAAHAMSPIGGVGINLAVQDAVAAGRILAAPLRKHHVRATDLAKVMIRRMAPTLVVQALQRTLHRVIFAPAVDGAHVRLPAAAVAALRRFPVLGAVPAYLVGMGLLPEHAPAFARR